MKRRVFIAINLPEKIKKKLVEYRERYDILLASQSLLARQSLGVGGGGGWPVRWTKKNSLHLTLIFIGYVSNEQALEICRVVRGVTEKAEPFMIRFKKIIPGPARNASQASSCVAGGPVGKSPRMIWVEGEKSNELVDLKNQLEDALLNVDSGLSRKDYKSFTPHMTLARVNQTNKSLPENFDWASIEEPFNFQVSVQSIEVMESDLRSDGAEYAVLESCPLGE